jgi:alkanesulfonate monooxygenase SsuD/methylene tetrahydromethanopterin reductase-like flavin-dependent oxidoreductase (luciferase family)
MFNSAAEEIGQWAKRCQVWATGAQTPEQRTMLHNLERLLRQAAAEAERDLDLECGPCPFAPTKS